MIVSVKRSNLVFSAKSHEFPRLARQDILISVYEFLIPRKLIIYVPDITCLLSSALFSLHICSLGCFYPMSPVWMTGENVQKH